MVKITLILNGVMSSIACVNGRVYGLTPPSAVSINMKASEQ